MRGFPSLENDTDKPVRPLAGKKKPGRYWFDYHKRKFTLENWSETFLNLCSLE